MAHSLDASQAALEFAKHLITLSSGVIAVSAAFVAAFGDVEIWTLPILLVAWALLTVSIVGSLDTTSRIVMSRMNNVDDWSTETGLIAARLSRWCFLLGLLTFALFAAVVVLSGGTDDGNGTVVEVDCPCCADDECP